MVQIWLPQSDLLDLHRRLHVVTTLAYFAITLALYSVVSRRLERSVFTAPMIFVAVGLFLGFDPMDSISVQFEDVDFLWIGEIALVLILFSDATRVQLSELRSGPGIPLRLLTIGLLLTLAAGAGIGAVIFTSLSFWEAAVLAAILAPTDAGLGQAVISDHRVPERVRNSLNVESGLNDGIVTPFFVIFVGIVVAEEEQKASVLSWLSHIFSDLLAGAIAGLVIGFVGARLIRWSLERDWITSVYQRMVYPGIAIAAWQVAEQVEGNGFVAAFVAGAVTAWVLKNQGELATSFIEVGGELAALGVFFAFGIAATGIVDDFYWDRWIYALLSLTLIRMLPVALSLIGTRLNVSTELFVGWFGPRGLASIVLLLLLVNDNPEVEGIPIIAGVVTLTVLASVYAHGFSVNPLIAIYQKHLSKLPPDAPEFGDAAEMRTRITSVPRHKPGLQEDD